MILKRIVQVAFALAVAAYVFLIFLLTIIPAQLLYAKPPEPQAPFTTFLRIIWKHELAMLLTGSAVVAYAVFLFRKKPDWRPFAVLIIGTPFAVGIFNVFGL